MDTKMLSDFMKSRHSGPLLLLAAAVISAISVACQKDPLLAPTGSTITLTSLSANGGTTVLRALVRDSNGNGLSSVTVAFSTTTGNLGSTSADSDANGVA